MEESPVKSPVKRVPQPHGGVLVYGATGGKQPGAGRPPDAWRAKLRELASREDTVNHLSVSLSLGPGAPEFWKALDYVTEHGHGKATQRIEHTGSVVLTAEERESRLRELVAKYRGD